MYRLHKSLVLLAGVLFPLWSAALQLTVDTSAWNGTTGYATYDLIDGTSSVTRVSYSPLLVDGIPTGMSGVLEDLHFYNSVSQPLALRDSLVFTFHVDQGSNPGPGFLPDSFALFLLNASGFPLFATRDPSGADSLLQWDIGAPVPTVFAGILSDPVDVQNVPEPGALILLATGFAAFAFARTLRRRRILLSLVTGWVIASSSSVFAAPSLSASTDLGSQVQMTPSGLRLNRQTNTFDSVLTIRNVSSAALEKPFTIAVYALPPGVVLTNATAVSEEGIPLVTMDSGGSVRSGDSVSVTLKFANRTHEAFPISLRIIRLPQPVPGLARLLGPDANGNGVRDDLESMLDSRYGGSPNKRNAAIQVLTSMRAGLAATGSTETAFAALQSYHKAYDCMVETAGVKQGIEEAAFLRDRMLDSRERVKAWILLGNKVAGQSIPVGTSNACELP